MLLKKNRISEQPFAVQSTLVKNHNCGKGKHYSNATKLCNCDFLAKTQYQEVVQHDRMKILKSWGA
jgi:hypothetical protein